MSKVEKATRLVYSKVLSINYVTALREGVKASVIKGQKPKYWKRDKGRGQKDQKSLDVIFG